MTKETAWEKIQEILEKGEAHYYSLNFLILLTVTALYGEADADIAAKKFLKDVQEKKAWKDKNHSER